MPNLFVLIFQNVLYMKCEIHHGVMLVFRGTGGLSLKYSTVEFENGRGVNLSTIPYGGGLTLSDTCADSSNLEAALLLLRILCSSSSRT